MPHMVTYAYMAKVGFTVATLQNERLLCELKIFFLKMHPILYEKNKVFDIRQHFSETKHKTWA